MTYRLKVLDVLDLASKAVEQRGKAHVQRECIYLSVTKKDDSLTYRAECFVGMILWLLVGAERFIATAPEPGCTNPTNGPVETGEFDAWLDRLNVKITPSARQVLNFMQTAQDGRLSFASTLLPVEQQQRPWGEVLAYARTMNNILNLSNGLGDQFDAEEKPSIDQFVATDAEVQRLLAEKSVILAIKRVRTEYQCSLVDAKNAVDAFRNSQPF